MPGPRLISVGYEGRSVDELISTLRAHSVSVLVDVRLTPLSRKPGLSKRRLAEALRGAGIEYVHLRALGNPKDNRDGFRRGEPGSWDRFRALLDEDLPVQALAQVKGLLDHEVVAVLCFERDHDTCHRRLVTDAVQAADATVELVAV